MKQLRLVETVSLRKFPDDSRALVPWQGAEVVDGDVRPLPALPEDAPIIHIGPRPAPQPAQHESREARREPKLETDVAVPLAQAAITAFAIGIPAALLAWALAWGWRVPVVVFALALAVGWLWRLRLVDKLLWNVETWVDRDLDGDGVKGKPIASYTVLQPAAARAEVARETRTAEADGARAALLEFIDRCFVKGTSEAAHGVKATGPDRAEYTRKRDVLLSLGAACWRNPQRPRAGWRMCVSRQKARQLVEKHILST